MKRMYGKSEQRTAGQKSPACLLTKCHDSRGFPTTAGKPANKIKKWKRFITSGLSLPLVTAAFLFILFMTILSPAVLTAEEKGKGLDIVSPSDYIQKNLDAYKELLRKLKELYENQYGSLFEATSPTDVATLAKEFPKPATLRMVIRFPQTKEAEEQKVEIERGEYFVNHLYGDVEIDPLFYVTGGFNSERDGKNSLVAAHPVTTQLLGIPQKVRLSHMSADIHWMSSVRSETTGSCCTTVGQQSYCTKTSASGACTQREYYNYCSKYAEIPYFGSTWSDPRYYANVLNLTVEKGEGVAIDDKLKNITFTSPGQKDIKIVSNRKFSSDDPYRIYRSCVPQFSLNGINKTVSGYKPAGKIDTDFYFKAVTFKKFGFPGYEMDASYGDMPALDYFYEQKTISGQNDYGIREAGQLSPIILLDYGDAGGLKAIMAFHIQAPVTWSTTATGPFTVDEGRISYRGGVGATKFMVTLGGYESVEHSITANMVQVVLDAAMGRGKVAPGKEHKVLIRVKGPADLANYQVQWTGEGGNWTQSATPFSKVGEEWQAEGKFSVPFGSSFDAGQLGNPVKIAGDIIRTKDNKKIYSYKRQLLTSYPAIDKLELYAGVNNKEPQKVEAPIDIFLSSDIPIVELTPRLLLKDGQPYNINMVSPEASIEVTSSNPGAVYVTQENARSRTGRLLIGRNMIAAHPGANLGTAKLTARMGGSDIDMAEYAQFTGDRKELKSETVEINVNSAFLLGESGSGGKTAYKLVVVGPSDMSGYHARWTAEMTTFVGGFKKEADGYATTVETTLRMDKVAIEKAGEVMAVLNVKTMVRNMNIRLLPPKPPVTTVQQVAVNDFGSLETITACKKSVTAQMEQAGFNPGMSTEDYCREQRKKGKEEILAQREDQKAFNEMVRNLRRQGQELVIMSDTMRVGAAVKGDLTTMSSPPFCYWTLEKGGALTLENVITAVELISQTEGGCFNIVKGLSGGFDPDTIIKVDLVMISSPATPKVIVGERVVANGGFLR
jgi:hypothetical protein